MLRWQTIKHHMIGGLCGALGITREQALHHLEPSRANELRELWKMDKKDRACLAQFLPEYAKAPNGKAPNGADEAPKSSNGKEEPFFNEDEPAVDRQQTPKFNRIINP